MAVKTLTYNYIAPRVLYLRVSVFFYSDKKDALTVKHLFNDRAWEKAKSAFKEILIEKVSDLSNIKMCMHQLSMQGKPKKYHLGIFVYHVIRSTNLTDLSHKSIVSV